MGTIGLSRIHKKYITMKKLENMKCEACKEGAPTLTPIEINDLFPSLPEWQIKEIDNIKRLVRTFKFSNYKDCITFTMKIGEIADMEDHHPAILTEWGKVTVSWWSHKIKGLHKNDFIMAAKTDRIYEEWKMKT